MRVVLLSFLDLEGSFTLCLTMRDLIVDCENFLQRSLLELWYVHYLFRKAGLVRCQKLSPDDAI